jgi:transcriptional regulator with XRE-family HTH domain
MISEDEVNAFASRTLRALREKSGLSQTTVGDEIGVSFQQVQKYEWNINRLSIGRCAQFAEFFSVPITTFFPSPNAAFSDASVPPTTMRIIRLLNKTKPKYHDLVYAIVKAVAQMGTRGEDEKH